MGSQITPVPRLFGKHSLGEFHQHIPKACMSGTCGSVGQRCRTPALSFLRLRLPAGVWHPP